MGAHRQGKYRHQHGRFGQGGDGHFPGRTHAAKGRADVHAGQYLKSSTQGKKSYQHDDVGDLRGRQIDRHQRHDGGGQHGRGKDNIRRGPENPRGRMRGYGLFLCTIYANPGKAGIPKAPYGFASGI